MNEIICSITSAIEEGRSWGHTDKEIADYIYAKHIRPLETKLAEAPEPRAAFLEGFMLTTKSRNGENPFAGARGRRYYFLTHCKREYYKQF